MKFAIITLLMILTQMVPASSTLAIRHTPLIRMMAASAVVAVGSCIGGSLPLPNYFPLSPSTTPPQAPLQPAPPLVLPRGIKTIPKQDGAQPSGVSQERANKSLHIAQMKLMLLDLEPSNNTDKNQLKSCHRIYKQSLMQLGWTVGAETEVENSAHHIGYSANIEAIMATITVLKAIASPVSTALAATLELLGHLKQEALQNGGHIDVCNYSLLQRFNTQLWCEVSARDVGGTENATIAVYALMIRSKETQTNSIMGSYNMDDLECVVRVVTLECSPEQWNDNRNYTDEFRQLGTASRADLADQAWDKYLNLKQRGTNYPVTNHLLMSIPGLSNPRLVPVTNHLLMSIPGLSTSTLVLVYFQTCLFLLLVYFLNRIH